MKNFYVILILLIGSVLVGCATTAPTQFYRPANYAGEPYRIAGRYERLKGLNGSVIITINDKIVVNKSLPLFTNTTDADGVFENKKISTTITRIKTFASSYIRADVFIGAEKAASLTF